MHSPDRELLSWVNSGKSKRTSVTLGQLILLLEMAGSESVAAISGGNLSQAVNYRQKLSRLERSLGIGKLTTSVGKTTKLSDHGRRIAGEIRMLLTELRSIAAAEADSQTWVIAAGESWLQSVIVPAIGQIARTHPEWKWDVRNLRARDICKGVRDGEIHFGFVRRKDIRATDRADVSRSYPAPAYAVVAGNVNRSPQSAKQLITWLLSQQHPLFQQGSSWRFIQADLSRELKLGPQFSALEPHIVCQSHAQAVAGATASDGWCIVPWILARICRTEKAVVVKTSEPPADEEMALICCDRRLTKTALGEAALEGLKTALGTALRSGA